MLELILLPLALAGLVEVWLFRWRRAREFQRFAEEQKL